MTIELTDEQSEAMSLATAWYKESNDPVFKIFGYAGTGKTTIAREIEKSVNGKTQYASFTGKAAHVMKRAGCYNACTIHSLIYKPLGDDTDETVIALELKIKEAIETGKETLALALEKDLRRIAEGSSPSFILNPESRLLGTDDHPAPRLLVVDEVSMVDEYMAKDLLSFEVPILVLGDPGQLPPIKGQGYFSDDPDYTLREIHRQSKGNKILDLATQARTGQPLSIENDADVQVLSRAELGRDALYEADQILVGRNATRHDYNARYRVGKWGDDWQECPLPGDKVICRRNNHDRGLFNGSQWIVTKCEPLSPFHYMMDLKADGEDGHVLEDVPAHRCRFKGEEVVGTWGRKKAAEEFEFAYAITVHVSQGSQFDSVVLFDESSMFRDNARRWLYTGITRAAKKLTVVR